MVRGVEQSGTHNVDRIEALPSEDSGRTGVHVRRFQILHKPDAHGVRRVRGEAGQRAVIGIQEKVVRNDAERHDDASIRVLGDPSPGVRPVDEEGRGARRVVLNPGERCDVVRGDGALGARPVGQRRVREELTREEDDEGREGRRLPTVRPYPSQQPSHRIPP